eukprot:3010589-Prymnesium_polylepis.1
MPPRPKPTPTPKPAAKAPPRPADDRGQGRKAAIATAQKKERESANPTPTLRHFIFGKAPEAAAATTNAGKSPRAAASPARPTGGPIITWTFTGDGDAEDEQSARIGGGIHYIFGGAETGGADGTLLAEGDDETEHEYWVDQDGSECASD